MGVDGGGGGVCITVNVKILRLVTVEMLDTHYDVGKDLNFHPESLPRVCSRQLTSFWLNILLLAATPC